MERLDKILKQALAKRGLSGTARSAQICFYAGEWASGRFEPISFSHGVLKVAVQSSPAAAELEIIKEDLIDFVNQKLKSEAVRSLRIVVKW